MKKFLLLCFSLAFVFTVWAQERTVSGRVTSTEDGSALPGVNVVVKGTATGTVTDADGRYTISVPSSGGSLVFSFIGLQTQEVPIGERSVVDVSLALDVTQLSEVVVTSQGIARDKKALGYAVTSVGSEQIAARPIGDISRVLQGKIPGVVINPVGGTTGTGAQINIRGYSTITGNTQPLWVVDGVPFNSSTNDQSGFTTGGAATATSRFQDLDPNTIESISVLKGLAATALYGTQGRNGVILVTTKAGSGKKKTPEVTFQQTLAQNEIASLPEFQNDYGNGFQQLYGNFFSNWGAHFDEFDSIGHPYQFLSDPALRLPFASQTYWKRIPWEAAPSVGRFFRKGMISNTALTVTGGGQKMNITASLGYTTEEGYAPGNDLTRVNASIGFNGSVTDKFTVRSSFMYSNSDFQTPPLNGATGGGASFGGVPSLYANFLYTPRNLDINDTDLFPFETPEEHKSVWYRGPNDIPSARWIAKYTLETDVTDRFFSSSSFTYDFNENMSLQYRVGLDTYTQNQSRQYNKGIGPTYQVINNGVYQTQSIQNTIWNHDLIFSLQREISSDISLKGLVGLNARNDRFDRNGIYSENQIVFGFFRHSNFNTSAPNSAAFDGRFFESTSESQLYGTYAEVVLGYKDFAYLNLTGRNDWSSALEKGNNSQFYPSVSASFIATDAFSNLKSNTLNFLKARVGVGTSANYPAPYGTRTVIASNARSFVDAGNNVISTHQISNFLGNLNLKPELYQEIEAGIEAKLLNERIAVDLTAFNRRTLEGIVNAPIDPSTGFTSTLLNQGKIDNKGIEAIITGTPIKLSSGFQWDVTLNFTLIRTEVVSLGVGLDEIALSGFTDLGNFAVPGRPMNIIKGTTILKDPDGNRVVGSDGLHVIAPQIGELGDPNPKHLTTLINNFSFKGISLSFQFDYRHGGQMVAWTPAGLLARGVLAGRDNFDRDQIFILPGVKQIGVDTDGDPIYAPNDIQITAADYGFNSQFFGRNDNSVFDVTTIRLREVNLGYTLPKSLLSKTPIKSASIIFTGNNLWFNAVNVPKYVNFDPEVSSLGVNGGIGFDYLTGPSMRRYGVVLRVSF
ncbi:MAG: SusC/RagA family TonB-linked outer membrane protein [Cyclobacteriaceae bacterium]|nr:SusC/RagA family TonB-linked outer membrane protein [Cyclobacteriaceae bacterium]QOI96021.1 MAG: SusC/RagA family TonB-linked outer membrane protein [Flammeovirgaceae bacterium]